jgi:hypothetical protein
VKPIVKCSAQFPCAQFGGLVPRVGMATTTCSSTGVACQAWQCCERPRTCAEVYCGTPTFQV